MDDHINLAFQIGPLPDRNMVAVRLGAVTRVTLKASLTNVAV